MPIASPFRSAVRALPLVIGWWFLAATAQALEPVLQATVPQVREESALLAPASSAAGWYQQVFRAASLDAKARALEQIEALGLAPNADSCIRAVSGKNRRLVNLFIQSGFDLNARGEHQRTALLTAALGQDWSLVDELLKAGASPNGADENGATALMAAAMAREAGPLKTLLQAGAETSAKDQFGHTALHYAISALNQPAVAALLAAGAPPNEPCCAEHDLVAHALETKKKEIYLPVLEAQTGELPWSPAARAVLQGAIAARDPVLTRLFFTKFAGAPTAEGQEQPLLTYAVLNNDLEMFRFLLSCGADPNTPLNSPVDKDFGAQIPSAFTRLYATSDTGVNTLMLAAGLDRRDFVSALLEGGCKRNLATGKYKMLALFFAAHSESPEMIQLLLGDCPTPEQMRIEISLSSQRAVLYKNGASVFSTPVSTGRTGFSTPAGRYVVTDKHLTHRSTLYPAEMPFFMRLSYRDFGMHQGALPGYPASHGCIRLPSDAARQLYKDVPVGTLVSISR